MSQELSVGGLVQHSKYLKRFLNLHEQAPGTLVLEGDLVIIEALPKLEKTVTLEGGTKLFIADAKTHKMTHNEKTMEFGVVVMAGPGDVDENGDRFAMNVKVGQIVLLPGNVAWYSQFGSLANYEPYTLGITRASQILFHFTDANKCFEVLNANV